MTPEYLAARLESGWCPIESPADMERAAAELRRLAAVEAERDALLAAIPEGCTPADAAMLREANHQLAAERDALAARPAVPAGMVLVPVEVLEDAATAIGHFVSDHGWSAEDMQAMDNLDAYIARHKANAAPATPSPAPDCED
jgi:hypothetical protein